MIYGLLWLAYVGVLLSIRHTSPKVQVKYGALAGVALSAAGWLCYRTGFEPGPTSPSVRWAALGLFAVLTFASLLDLARRFVQSEETLEEWPLGVNLPFVFVSAFVFAAGTLGYSAGLAITGGVLIYVLSIVVGRRRIMRDVPR